MKRRKTVGRALSVVFGDEDKYLAALLIRLCVLFEDLRLELLGSSADVEQLQHLDDTSARARKMYFLRKAIGTLAEFAESFRLLDGYDGFKKIRTLFSESDHERWSGCVHFFNAHEEFIELVRNDVGGHFGVKAAEYVVRNLDDAGKGYLEICLDYEEQTGGMRLQFVDQLANTAMRRHRKSGETDEEFVKRLLNVVGDGFKQAAGAANILGSHYICPKFLPTRWT
jgi:hypothetical protein